MPVFPDHPRCGCAGPGQGPSPRGLRCVVRLARGLLQTGQATCSWKLRLSRGGSPCRAATEPRPTHARKRGEDPQHLPTSPPHPPLPCPLLCDVHAPGRENTAVPQGLRLVGAPSASFCASKVPTCPCMLEFPCIPAPGVLPGECAFVCARTQCVVCRCACVHGVCASVI